MSKSKTPILEAIIRRNVEILHFYLRVIGKSSTRKVKRRVLDTNSVVDAICALTALINIFKLPEDLKLKHFFYTKQFLKLYTGADSDLANKFIDYNTLWKEQYTKAFDNSDPELNVEALIKEANLVVNVGLSWCSVVFLENPGYLQALLVKGVHNANDCSIFDVYREAV